MKKLYLLLPILFLIYWGCEDEPPEVEVDTTPPTITIISPQDGSTVSVIVSISCISSDNEGVEKVELWVNGVPTDIIDNTEPYSLEWNTLTYDDGSYGITVRSYDTSGNTTDSDPNTLVVYKTVELWGVVYSVENSTSLSCQNCNFTGSIPPEIGYLTSLDYLRLSDNQLTGSIPPEIGYLTKLTHLRLGNTELTGSIPPELGNLINLIDLELNSNYLTGSIPPEIWNLTNLTQLGLGSNQLTGEIPESICDLNIDWSNSDYFYISNNQFCPPYPSCIEDYVGEQDTSDCP